MTVKLRTRASRPLGRWSALYLLALALFIDVMGSTSVFTAGPAIERSLNLNRVELQWTIVAATLPAGALLLVGGRLADRFGRVRMFSTGLALLVLASLACGTAGSAGVLIVARAAQGLAGALLLPAALGLLIGLYPGEDERHRALAVWSAIGGIGATAGLLLGGLVTTGFGWNWVFLVNVPVGVGMLALVPVLLQEPPAGEQSGGLDVLGMATFSVGLGLLIYAAGEAPARGWWDGRTLGFGLTGAAVVAAFAVQQVTGHARLLPPRLLRSRPVMSGNLTLLAAGICVDGLLFTLTLYLQQARGYTPLQYGAVCAVMTVASVAAAAIAERGVARVGTRGVCGAGVALLGLTCAVFVAMTSRHHPLPLLIVGMLIFGLGMGCAYVAGSVASVQVATDEDAGVAAAIQNISFTLGAALGVALFSTVAAARLATADGTHAAVRVVALADASRAAFTAGAVVAAVGAIGLVALRQPRRARSDVARG